MPKNSGLDPTKAIEWTLIDACDKGLLKTVRRLLKQGVAVDCLDESTGSHPLLAACAAGHLDVATVLLDEGADPNLPGTWIYCPPNSTPLEMACSGGYSDVVRLLVSGGADIEKKGYWKPIQTAVSYGRANIIEYVIAKGASLSDDSLLTQAVRAGNTDCVRLLIQAGVRLNSKRREEWTPLHQATSLKSAEIAELLIATGAKIDVPTPHMKETPLHLAAKRGNLEVVKALVRAGTNVELKGWKKKTAEQWARTYGHKEVAAWLYNYRKGTTDLRAPVSRLAAERRSLARRVARSWLK